jgi:hypothetical protein
MQSREYSAVDGTGPRVSVFKRLSLVLSALDTFLNNPLPGFKKNSFQDDRDDVYAATLH